MTHSTLFNPFRGHRDHHENSLTWAFIVMLKYAPVLQRTLYQHVTSHLPAEHTKHLNAWDVARCDLQTGQIEAEGTRFLVSVLLTDDCTRWSSIDVSWLDRRPVYDGLIAYPNGFTFIIENKPSSENVWQNQLSPSRSSYQGNTDDVTLYRKAVCLEWPVFLEDIRRYADSGVSGYMEREIINDFFAFVEMEHEHLTPYRTYEICTGRKDPLERRTVRLLKEMSKETGLPCKKQHGGLDYIHREGKIAERIFITVGVKKGDIENWCLDLRLYPADTVGQARSFFSQVDRDAFFDLASSGWCIKPNLHFSFINRHQCWAKDTAIGAEEYFDGFKNKKWAFRKISVEDELPSSLTVWENAGLTAETTRQKITERFINTDRTTINVIPGFELSFKLACADVLRLERENQLKERLINLIRKALSTWNENLENSNEDDE